MAFNVEDFPDLVRLLEEHPEWRAELRRRVLSDELLDLPAALQRLAEAQERTQQDVSNLAKAVQDLSGELRLLTALTGKHEGDLLQINYERHAPAYFGPIARRLRLVDSYRLADLLDDGVAEGRITDGEWDDAILADIVLRGRRRDDSTESYLVVEVSAGIREDDVRRAARRAGVVAKLGAPVVPVVAGEDIGLFAQRDAQAAGAWIVLNGRAAGPDVRPPNGDGPRQSVGH